MEAAERREDDPHNQGQRDGEDQSQHLVDHVLAELKQSVAADPHLVEGVGELGLRDHILEPQLEQEEALPSRGAGERGARRGPPWPRIPVPAPAPPASGPARPGPHLQVGVQPVGVAVQLVLRALLRLRQRGAAAPREVVVVVHKDAGVHLLRLQPHGAAAAARLRPGPAPSAAAAPPGRAGAERGCPGHAPGPAAGALQSLRGPRPAGLPRPRSVSPIACGARLAFVSLCGIAAAGSRNKKRRALCSGTCRPLCRGIGKEGGRRGESSLPTEVPLSGPTGLSHSSGIYLTCAA